MKSLLTGFLQFHDTSNTLQSPLKTALLKCCAGLCLGLPVESLVMSPNEWLFVWEDNLVRNTPTARGAQKPATVVANGA